MQKAHRTRRCCFIISTPLYWVDLSRLYGERINKMKDRMNMSYINLNSINPTFRNVVRFEFTHFLVAYCAPLVSFIVLFINSLLLWILWKKKATDTTHLLVAATCISETLYAFVPTMYFTYLYDIKKLRSFLPYQYCFSFHLFIILWNLVFRCHSTWLTVVIATQRFICVTYPFKAASIITRKRTIMVIVGLFLISLLTQYYDVIFVDRMSVNISWGPDTSPRETCIFLPAEWAEDYVDTLFPIHTIGSILLLNFIPSLWLVVVGCLLIRELRVATKWRKKFTVSTRSADRRLNGERKLTVLTIWIILTFVTFQIPLSVLDSIISYQRSIGGEHGSNIIYATAAKIVTHFILLLTLPSTFFIYIICIKEYYEYVKTLLCCRNKHY